MSATPQHDARTENAAAGAQSSVVDLAPQELLTWQREKDPLVVDVRETFEHATDHIFESVLHPLGKLDPKAVQEEAQGRPVVFYCRTGRRSAEAAQAFREATGGGEPAYHLGGGIVAWKSAGLPVARLDSAPPVDVMRQVQLVVGFLVLLGSILAATVTPWFLLLTGFVGAGLFFAGATGFCGMAKLLGYMPWNRAVKGASSCSTCTS